VVATIAYTLWHHPYLTLAGALIVLVLLMLLVRTIFRATKRALRGLRPAAPTTG
jgi:hypothetical protein